MWPGSRLARAPAAVAWVAAWACGELGHIREAPRALLMDSWPVRCVVEPARHSADFRGDVAATGEPCPARFRGNAETT